MSEKQSDYKKTEKPEEDDKDEIYKEETPWDCTEDDCGLAEMTMRDLYAIMQNKPVSKKKWLNDLIKGQTYTRGPLHPG